MLTSKDPDYAAKVARVHSILSTLSSNDAFFSIDEFGPFAIKMKGGLSLMPSGEQRVVPQWQPSKGNLIITAALELGGNQVSHFYSPAKNTGEMIRMMDMPVTKYAHLQPDLSVLGRGILAHLQTPRRTHRAAQCRTGS